MLAHLVATLALMAAPSAPAASPFTPLLEQGAEWSYTPYGEDSSGAKSELATPGELRLKVVLVRPVGKHTVVGLQPLLDGVEADRLVSDFDLTRPVPLSPLVLSVGPHGLEALELSLEDAAKVDEAGLAPAAKNFSDPLVFPASPKKGWTHAWRYEDPQQEYQAKGTLSLGEETIGGRAVQTWTVSWKGKACFAGECTPFAGEDAYAPELGLVRVCRIDLSGTPPLHCLRLVGRASGPAAPAPGAPPTLGDVWRAAQAKKPAIAKCLALGSSISVLGFTIQPDGTLTQVKEKNQSGKEAQCTTTAFSDLRFPPFEGPAKTIERLSFSRP